MNRKFSNSKGISLISLIITIIVIIILAAVVIFSGMDTPEKAQLSKVISDIDNVQTAVDQAYYGLYTEKAVAGEVWTKSQFYEAVATGEKNRDNLTRTGLVEISENSLVDINLPVYEGRKWYVAVSDMSDTVQTGSVVLDPGFESQGKIYATLLDVQTGGSTGSGTTGNSGIVEPENIDDWDYVVMEDGNIKVTRYRGRATTVVIPNYIGGVKVTVVGDGNLPLWDESICSRYDGTYWGCYQETITKVIISEGIEEISYSAFCRSEALQSVIIPDSVKSIGTHTFYGCNSLESVTIPNSVTSIGEWTFSFTNLKSVTIPDSIKSIGGGAFSYCYSLESVTIPSSVTSMEYGAFSNLSSSALIKCEVSSKPSGWDSSWTNCTNIIWGAS